MKTRRLLIFIVCAVALATLVVVILTTYWQRKLPVFTDTPKLMSAVRAFSRDLTVRGQPLPATVSLRELISGGYIAASDVRAFEGMEVTISLRADETRPQTVLVRARSPDGRVFVVRADGSAQEVSPHAVLP